MISEMQLWKKVMWQRNETKQNEARPKTFEIYF